MRLTRTNSERVCDDCHMKLYKGDYYLSSGGGRYRRSTKFCINCIVELSLMIQDNFSEEINHARIERFKRENTQCKV